MRKWENDKSKSEKMANQDEMMRGMHLLNKVNIRTLEGGKKSRKWQMKSEKMANEDEMMRGHLLHCPGQHPREQGHNVIQIEPNQCSFTTKNIVSIQNWEESRSEIRLREAGAGSHIQGEMGRPSVKRLT